MPGERDDLDAVKGTDAPLIRSSVLFAAARDVLMDHFSDARVTGLKLGRLQAELLSSDIVERAFLMEREILARS